VIKEKVQFVVQARCPSQQRFQSPVLHLLPWSMCSIVCCRRCLAFDGCDSRLAGCWVDPSSTQVALQWVSPSGL
jgi:hypothetical protein